MIDEYIDFIKNGFINEEGKRVGAIGHAIYDVIRVLDIAKKDDKGTFTTSQLSILKKIKETLKAVQTELNGNPHFDGNSLAQSISNAFSLVSPQLVSGLYLSTGDITISLASLMSQQSLTSLLSTLSEATKYASKSSKSQRLNESNRSKSEIVIN